MGISETERKIRQEKIYDYYKREFPTDDLGEEINRNVTFCDLYCAMYNGKDIYVYIGVRDSLVRERIFKKLAEIFKLDYESVYKIWLCN